MAAKSDLDLEKVTIRIIRGNKATLTKYFPDASYNSVMRTIIDNYCKALEAHHQKEEETNDRNFIPVNL